MIVKDIRNSNEIPQYIFPNIITTYQPELINSGEGSKIILQTVVRFKDNGRYYLRLHQRNQLVSNNTDVLSLLKYFVVECYNSMQLAVYCTAKTFDGVSLDTEDENQEDEQTRIKKYLIY